MARLALRPMLPGVLLMRHLRLPVKLALLGLVLIAPLAVLVLTIYSGTHEEITTASLELDGARQVSQLVDIVTRVQAHRDLAIGNAGGTEKQQRSQLLGEITSLAAALDKNSLGADPGYWPATRQALAELAEDRAPTRRDELFALHGRLIERVQRQMFLTAEGSGLLLDPEAPSFFLMDLGVERLVPWLESLSQARGQGSAMLARGEITHVERATMLGHASHIDTQLADLQLRLDALGRSGIAAPAEWAGARAASEKLAAQIRSAFTEQAITADPATYDTLAGSALAQGATLKGKIIDALVQQLEQRVRHKTLQLWAKVGLACLGVLAVVYLALAFYLSFTGALRRLHDGVNEVLAGDLSHRIVIDGRDELAEIGTMVESMNQRLSSLVAEIRSSAARVTMSGETVAAGSQSLAERTEQQAASLRQTVATVQHLAAAVSANAAEASELDQLTARLRDQAEAGGAEMRASIEAMAQLEDSSRRVAEIIGVIDSIAFQTNILALNAAVEAARAGTAGRGFAVVATEVRELAQRCSKAAAEIRTLIARTSEQVEGSVQRTRHAGDALGALVEGVRKVSMSLQAIAQASARQSSDLQEVTASVGNLDEITRQNGQMVEQSAAAAGELVNRAGALRESVATMRLRQGSADEARTLVERALALIHERGATAAAPALRSREQGFVDRDLYVFVLDRAGRYLLHGTKPQAEGQRVHDVPGIDGDRFVREAWAAATSHEGRGGWVEYDILNPETGKVQPKASFVVMLDEQRLVGCGIYRSQAAATA